MAVLLAQFFVINFFYPEISFEAPSLSSSFKETDASIPFDSFFDISKFPFLVSTIPDGMKLYKFPDFRFETGFYPANSVAAVPIKAVDNFTKVLNQTMVNEEKEPMLQKLLEFPSEKLRNSTEEIRNSILKHFNVSSFSCLHLRIEDDFKKHFKKEPAYYSAERIAQKIKNTILQKTQNSEKFPSELLFIAGNIDDSVLLPFQNLQIWRNITHKGHFMGFNVTSVPKTIFAALDFEICKMADFFVGNNHSSWSELLADFLLWVRGKTWDKDVLMVNAPRNLTDDSQLYPFCSANHRTRHKGMMNCTYYRHW